MIRLAAILATLLCLGCAERETQREVQPLNDEGASLYIAEHNTERFEFVDWSIWGQGAWSVGTLADGRRVYLSGQWTVTEVRQ